MSGDVSRKRSTKEWTVVGIRQDYVLRAHDFQYRDPQHMRGGKRKPPEPVYHRLQELRQGEPKRKDDSPEIQSGNRVPEPGLY